jgi:hypothetical protein
MPKTKSDSHPNKWVTIHQNVDLNEETIERVKAFEVEGLGCVVLTGISIRNPDRNYSLSTSTVFLHGAKIENNCLIQDTKHLAATAVAVANELLGRE